MYVYIYIYIYIYVYIYMYIHIQINIYIYIHIFQRKDKPRAKHTLNRLNKLYATFHIDTISNNKSYSSCLRKHEFHLNIKEAGEIALNYMNLLGGFTYSNLAEKSL